MASCDVASNVCEALERGARRQRGRRFCVYTADESGLADNACRVILHILDPQFLIELASHDVTSIICQALSDVIANLINNQFAVTSARGSGFDWGDLERKVGFRV
jgi:hypothetical protein